MVGEDIAWGTGLLSSPVAIVDSWMKSPPHRAVILTPQFREIGVGTALATKTWKKLSNVTFFTLDRAAASSYRRRRPQGGLRTSAPAPTHRVAPFVR